MPPNVPTWWTDDKVTGIVDSQYIHAHLRPDEQLLLTKSPSFGAGLTDDTYLDWILTRSRRFFLILVDVGIPDQIFGIIDDSYDDDDLPIAEEAVPDLCLSYEQNRSLDKRFYKAQFKYLIRIVGDSEHIRYAQEETVPIYPLGLRSAVLSLGKDSTDNVLIPSDQSRVFTRKRIALDSRVTEQDVLSEIASCKKFAHQHLISVYSSYLFDDSVYILLTPAVEYNLKSFLSDVPKSFENLPKQDRREILINWPHCLANGLAWLHENGRPHGIIRPSNVLIDNHFNIFFGSFDGAGILSALGKTDDIEAYQYAAPERWKRAVTKQTTGPAKTTGHSGGRTARKVAVKTESTEGKRTSWTIGDRLETAAPTATAYAFVPTSKSHFARLQLGKSDSDSVVSMSSSASRRSDQGSIATVRPYSGQRLRPETPSAKSSTSSGSNKTSKAALANPIFVAAPELRTAMVQTWHSSQYDLWAADMFSLGAVILGIITLLCKRSYGSFERHRSSKNRTAGRGGGLADASFHANTGQVSSWSNVLLEDAKKKSKKDDGIAFKAVGPILQLVNRCLLRDPEERLTAKVLEKELEEVIRPFVKSGKSHCWREASDDKESLEQDRSTYSTNTALSSAAISSSLYDDEITASPSRVDEWSALRSRGLVTSTIPTLGPESSFSSLSSFNFDYDINSDTVVDDDRSNFTIDHSERFSGTETKLLVQRLKSKSYHYNNWHNNESVVDPSLSQSPSSPQGGFNYRNYSGSISSEEENGNQRSFFLSESRRASEAPITRTLPPGPQGPLPAIPQQKHRSRRKESADVRPERFPAVPDWQGDRKRVPQSPHPPPETVINPRVSSLNSPFESTRKLQSQLNQEDGTPSEVSNRTIGS